MRWWGIIALFVTLSVTAAPFPKDKITIGRVEWVQLPDAKLRFRARIDTGAKTSSLHATGVEEVTKNGSQWVKFRVIDENGKEIELVRKVQSTQKVANPTGFSSTRYVIREKVVLGKVIREINVNLNDRGHMDYKFLVGRNLLMGHFVVDVARSHVMGD